MGKSDEVRRLLDERGVEHRDNDANRAVRYTRWNNGGKREVRYEEWSNGTTRLDAGNVTPEQVIAATVGRPKVKKVRGMTYDVHGGEVYYLACSGCGEWIDGDLDCITEYDGPNFCHNCGGEFDGPLLCKRCGGLADLEYGDMCAECYEEVGA